MTGFLCLIFNYMILKLRVCIKSDTSKAWHSAAFLLIYYFSIQMWIVFGILWPRFFFWGFPRTLSCHSCLKMFVIEKCWVLTVTNKSFKDRFCRFAQKTHLHNVALVFMDLRFHLPYQRQTWVLLCWAT